MVVDQLMGASTGRTWEGLESCCEVGRRAGELRPNIGEDKKEGALDFMPRFKRIICRIKELIRWMQI